MACYQLAQSSLKIGFELAKNVGLGGGGRAYSRHAMHMVIALAGCRMALVSSDWTTSHLVSINWHTNNSSPLVWAPLLEVCVKEALAQVSSASYVAPSRSGNMEEKRHP